MTPEMDIKEVLGVGSGTSPWKKRGYWIALLVLFIGSAVLWAKWHSRSAAQPVVHYRTELAQTGNLTVTVTATGQLKPTRVVDVGSQVSGIMDEVLVDYNQPVKHGQVMARINTDKLQAQVLQDEAQLKSSRAKVDDAKVTVWEKQAEYNRNLDARQRSKSNIISQHDIDTAKAAYDRAVVAVSTAEASVTQAEANLKIDQTNLGFAVITSPVDGVVLSRSVEPGQTIAASFQVATLFELAQDLKKMILQVNIDEADVGQVKEGQPVTFTVDAYPGRQFPGTITMLHYNATTTNNVVTYLAEISVNNDQLLLRSGMTATATITVLSAKNVLLVPNHALRFLPTDSADVSSGGLFSKMLPGPPSTTSTKSAEASAALNNPRVWVIRDNKPVPISVVVGATDGKFTKIETGALAPGTPLIVETLRVTK
jgi:HlyD family secretion protein